ncbi:Hypothetical predicted protein [Cloeon dipterum]|nr:Hypothetical predicted protein [Cloeon dipterum]
MAALDVRVSTSQDVAVILSVGKSEFVLCNLQRRHSVLQQQLDLNFLRGQEIVFSLCGSGKVTLTGFFVPGDFEESEEDEEGEEAPQLMPIADKKKKKKNVEIPLSSSNKKLKTLPPILNSDDDDESDDMMAEDSDCVEIEEDSEGEEEKDSDEDVEEESDDFELDSDGDDSEESDMEVPTPQKQFKSPKAQEQKTPNKARNGVATPKEYHSGKREKQAPKGRGRNVFK